MLKSSRIKQNILRFGLLVTAIVFIVAGTVREQYMDVMGKAIRICLECIGIG